METSAAQCDVSHDDSDVLSTEEEMLKTRNIFGTTSVSTSSTAVDAGYTEVELIYRRDGFNIRQQRQWQGPATISTLDAGVIASLLVAAFRGTCKVKCGRSKTGPSFSQISPVF